MPNKHAKKTMNTSATKKLSQLKFLMSYVHVRGDVLGLAACFATYHHSIVECIWNTFYKDMPSTGTFMVQPKVTDSDVLNLIEHPALATVRDAIKLLLDEWKVWFYLWLR